MAAMHIVIVAAGARPLGDKGTDMLNGRKAAGSAAADRGRHGKEGSKTSTKEEGTWGAEAQLGEVSAVLNTERIRREV